MKGESQLDDYKKIDYDNSTIDIKDYLGRVEVKLSNDSKAQLIKNGFWHKTIFNGFVTNGHFVKCFELGVEKEKYPNLQQVTYHFMSAKLLKDMGIAQRQLQRGFLNIHYSGQYLLQPNPNINNDLRTTINSHVLLYVKSIEFIRRRKNRNHDCVLDGKHYDQAVLNKHVQSKGCIAPYHRPQEGIPICYNRTELKNYYYDLYMARRKYHAKACQRLSSLNFEVQTLGSSYHWALYIIYPEEVKIIQQYKEVDGHALIGNIGGYIGLFLGTKIFTFS